MIEWTIIKAEKINRVGYNKRKESLYIDFKGSVTDSVYLKVPKTVYETFVHVKSPDQFYTQLVEGYFEVG